MGYAQYEVTRRDGTRIDAGYGVEAVCEEKGCGEKIDRGLGYLCGRMPGGDEHGCGGYFCGRHLFGDNRCGRCVAAEELRQLDEFADRLAEVLVGVEGIRKADAEEGHPRVHVELEDGSQIVLTLSAS